MNSMTSRGCLTSPVLAATGDRRGWRHALAVMLLAMLGFVAQPVQAQHREHGMDYAQRKQLARKLLAPQRDIATANEDFRQRLPNFLFHYAMLDPVWTARFMLEHPAPNDGVLYDLNAVRELMRRADVLPTDSVLGAIESMQFMRSDVALVAVKSLSDEKSELRERIIELVLGDTAQQPFQPMSFASSLELAGLSQDSEKRSQVERQISDFYESGRAKQLEDSLSADASGSGSFYKFLLERFAPSAVKASYQTTETNWYHLEQTILSNQALDNDQKRKQLRALESCSFGTQSYEILGTASLLGRVALVDEELALQWAESAPDTFSKIWAKLTIAPAIARRDAADAAELILSCYAELDEFDPNEQQFVFITTTPSDVACQGLQIVSKAAPAHFMHCLDTTLDIAQRFRKELSTTNYFQSITAIAAYAPDRAKSMFDRVADDVSVHDAANFFCALLAVDPESVWEEYQQMPDSDRSGNDLRGQIVNALVPALLQRTQSDYWSLLTKSNLLDIAPEILVDDAAF